MNMYDNIKNKLNNVKNDIISAVYAPPTESRFIEEGKLTPQEFIASGDALISMCPQWKWMPASAEKYKNKYLPDADKQYLIMEKVVCDQRVQELMDSIAVNEKEGDDEFIINDNKKTDDVVVNKMEALNLKDEEKKEDIDDDNVVVVEAPVERRYYDLSICYDLAYYTPHLFLQGVDEDNIPLKQNQVFEDIVSHYSNKTMTFE